MSANTSRTGAISSSTATSDSLSLIVRLTARIALTAARMLWLAQITMETPASRKAWVGVR